MANNQNKGGGARKYGRNKSSCTAYWMAWQASINQRNRLLRTLRRHPDNAEVAKLLVASHNVAKQTIDAITKRAQAKLTAKLIRTLPVATTYDDSNRATAKLRANVDAKLKAKADRKAGQAMYREARIPTMGRAIIDAQRAQLGLAPLFTNHTGG